MRPGHGGVARGGRELGGEPGVKLEIGVLVVTRHPCGVLGVVRVGGVQGAGGRAWRGPGPGSGWLREHGE